MKVLLRRRARRAWPRRPRSRQARAPRRRPPAASPSPAALEHHQVVDGQRGRELRLRRLPRRQGGGALHPPQREDDRGRRHGGRAALRTSTWTRPSRSARPYWYYVESISLAGVREKFTPVFQSKAKNADGTPVAPAAGHAATSLTHRAGRAPSRGGAAPRTSAMKGRRMRSLLLLPVAVLCFTGAVRAADDGHYATKADARAGRRTPGRAVPTPPPLDPDAGGENCGTATVIAGSAALHGQRRHDRQRERRRPAARRLLELPDRRRARPRLLVHGRRGQQRRLHGDPDERHLRSRDLRARHVQRRRHLRGGRRRLRALGSRQPAGGLRGRHRRRGPARAVRTPSAPTRSSSTRSTPRARPAAPRAACSAAPGPTRSA